MHRWLLLCGMWALAATAFAQGQAEPIAPSPRRATGDTSQTRLVFTDHDPDFLKLPVSRDSGPSPSEPAPKILPVNRTPVPLKLPVGGEIGSSHRISAARSLAVKTAGVTKRAPACNARRPHPT